ncbi:MAG: hypothetical protein HQL49_11915 [Gammaproteobacteria bacterium]|nr:hypothetical protein [Gammaproteobacteria bacterium]
MFSILKAHLCNGVAKNGGGGWNCLFGGLSAEVAEKLGKQRPATIGLASRLPGITPAAISILLVTLKKRHG